MMDIGQVWEWMLKRSEGLRMRHECGRLVQWGSPLPLFGVLVGLTSDSWRHGDLRLTYDIPGGMMDLGSGDFSPLLDPEKGKHVLCGM